MTTTKSGKSAGVTLPSEALTTAGTERGDTVALQAKAGPIELTTAHDRYTRSMSIGRAFIARYRRTLAALAK